MPRKTPGPPQLRPAGFVSELQGLDGAFCFSELILQRIWLRGEFDVASARTVDGLLLQVRFAGRWNRVGGPDFRDARLSIGGVSICGDVELHVHASDWESHGHAKDPEYDRVVLHVVLFPPGPGQRTLGAGGREIPTVALLSLLPHDIEAYALDDAAERLAGRPPARLFDLFSKLDPRSLHSSLLEHADFRWREKVACAALRLRRLGWEDACHHAALECLGCSGNRAPMLGIAGMFPLSRWVSGTVDPDSLFEELGPRWRLRSGRPANHPRTRLRQYLAWTRDAPDWPARLRSFSGLPLPACVPDDLNAFRKACAMPALRRRFETELCGGQLRGSRLDSFLCDACFPLLAASSQAGGLGSFWGFWYLGDLPDYLRESLAEARDLDPEMPANCNGLGQGLIRFLSLA
jgi:hypothetical protein